MTENNAVDPIPADAPEAVVRTKRSFSIVWLVPLAAALIGGWLAYKAYSEKGPTITIIFKSAEGLEAGKTKIKYKDVEIGQVEHIGLSRDLSQVVVTAKLEKQTEDHLTESTRFWVVRARVAGGEVSGLGTLFSGAYIGIDPGKGGKPERQFEGLEIPPIVTTDQPGGHFMLRTDNLGSLDVGTPIYFRKIKVGQVVGYKLEDDGKAVLIKIFVQAPHHERVRQNTRFWNASGLDVTVNAQGIKIDTESLVTILSGGVAFDLPENEEPGQQASDSDVFFLYENRAASHEKTYVHKNYHRLYFDGSVRGLTIGAPVELRGIQIGRVVDVRLEAYLAEPAVRIPVLIETEPERIAWVGPNGDRFTNQQAELQKLVDRGMRAQLKTGSIITGQLYVDIDFHPEAPPAKVTTEGEYTVMPTIPSSLETLTNRLMQMVDNLENVPLDQIGSDLRATVAGIERLVNSTALAEALQALNASLQNMQQLTLNLNEQLTPAVTTTLQQTATTLATAERLMNADSPMNQDMRLLFLELAKTARAVRAMADYLERYPESLIRGKGSAP